MGKAVQADLFSDFGDFLCDIKYYLCEQKTRNWILLPSTTLLPQPKISVV